MPMKEWFRKLQPVQLYVVLSLTIVFFVTELAISHLTHALTLLMNSYHMLCNIIALAGCIITVKHGKSDKNSRKNLKEPKNELEEVPGIECADEELSKCADKKSPTSKNQENKLKNTFGWARIDVIVMLICCVFLASLSFSLLVEAAQTLVHIDHQDEMHQPITVFCVGLVGLLLNGLCYILIGGYTFHQGSFLYVTESGDVVLDRVVTSDSVRKGERRLSRTRTVPPPKYRQRQGLKEMARDIVGCIFVIICAALVYFTDQQIAKYIDPILSIFSASILMILSYPYMKESCLILLQTIPGSIDINTLKKDLLEHFPDIINVHDFHVWQLTASKVISTVHIIFQNPKVYAKITREIKEFFVENGITQVTIQPEFYRKFESSESIASDKNSCLMKCNGEGCKLSHCCPDIVMDKNELSKTKSPSKEIITDDPKVNLKSIKIDNSEFTHANTKAKLENVSEKIDQMIDRGGEMRNNDESGCPSEEINYVHDESNLVISNKV